MDEPLSRDAEVYLRRLGACLSPLDPDERREIVAEVRTHFAERRRQGSADVLAGFEPPEVYAARFVEESALSKAVAQGGTVVLGRALLSGMRSGGETVLLVFPLVLAQLFAFVLFVLGLLKPFFFRNIGVFLAGGPFELGFVSDGGNRVDALGWWTVPAFIVPSAVVLWACNRAMRALAARRLARTSRRANVA